MNYKHSLAGLLVGVSFMTVTGCRLGTPPTLDLTNNQINAVLKCQTAIKKEGASFVALKLQELEKCLDRTLEIQLRGQDTALEDVRRQCRENYGAIGTGSAKLIEKIAEACEPVEELVLEDDVLQFQALGDAVGPGSFGSIEEIAGFICGVKELLVDVMVGAQVPRLCHILETLGPEFGTTTDGNCFPTPPLAEGCLPFLPPV